MIKQYSSEYHIMLSETDPYDNNRNKIYSTNNNDNNGDKNNNDKIIIMRGNRR